MYIRLFRFPPLLLFIIVLIETQAQSAGAQIRGKEKLGSLNSPYDLVVYGGTSAGVVAAVQARKMGKTAVIVCPDKHLGGLSAGGLGYTDTGDKRAIGGLAREFYHRIWLEYKKSQTWKWQAQEKYGNKGQGTPAIDGKNRTMWIFEPRVAEKVFEDMVAEYRVPVHRDEWINREPSLGVRKIGGRIQSITMLSGNTFHGRMFLDATYEGDLLATAKIQYHVGREGKNVYGENWNGVQTGVLHHRHHFGTVKTKISPYIIPGKPESGLISGVSEEHPGEFASGDNKIQAYCFRMCLTDHPENRVAFTKPKGYDPTQYELLARIYAAGWRETFQKFDRIPNRKTDTNNHGPFSTDNIGRNYEYPDASYEQRRDIVTQHVKYQQGLMYFLANDPRVPPDVQTKMKLWGLAKDEFIDNGNWPHQIYVREARRMIGTFVMTEHELLKRKPTPQPVGLGSYTMDSHNVQRYITPEGYVQNEGDIGVSTRGPYQIAFGSLVPKKEQCQNLLVPVCLSSSHIAYGSIRMEPVFMILAQSSATAAMMSLDAKIAVQDLPYDQLAKRLLADGQVLELKRSVKDTARTLKLEGIVVDDESAQTQGSWKASSANAPFVGFGYLHDDNTGKGDKSARFTAKLTPGRYEVRIAYPTNKNRATNVPLVIRHRDGMTNAILNQRMKPQQKTTTSIGVFDFATTGTVTISNKNTDGHVILDAVQFVPVKK